MDLPRELLPQIERVNRLLATQQTMPHKLEALAEVIERTVPGSDAVSVALVVEGSAVTGAASSQVAIEADLVQYAFNQGPCLLSVKEHRPVRIDLLRQDETFEHFAPGAVELGVESVLSVPVVWSGDVVGSFNLYSHERGAFSDATLDQVRPLADYAAEVIAHSPLYAASLDLVEGLVATVTDVDDIQMAVGMLMRGRSLDADAAWEQLRRQALAENASIADVARRLLARSRAEAEPGDGL